MHIYKSIDYHEQFCYLSDEILTSSLLILCEMTDDLDKLAPPVYEAFKSRIGKSENDQRVKTTICEALLQARACLSILFLLSIALLYKNRSFSSSQSGRLLYPTQHASE